VSRRSSGRATDRAAEEIEPPGSVLVGVEEAPSSEVRDRGSTVEVDAGNYARDRAEIGGGGCARQWGGVRWRACRNGGSALVGGEGTCHEQGKTTVSYAQAGWGPRGDEVGLVGGFY